MFKTGLVQQRGPSKQNFKIDIQTKPWQGGGVAGGGQSRTGHGNWFMSVLPRTKASNGTVILPPSTIIGEEMKASSGKLGSLKRKRFNGGQKPGSGPSAGLPGEPMDAIQGFKPTRPKTEIKLEPPKTEIKMESKEEFLTPSSSNEPQILPGTSNEEEIKNIIFENNRNPFTMDFPINEETNIDELIPVVPGNNSDVDINIDEPMETSVDTENIIPPPPPPPPTSSGLPPPPAPPTYPSVPKADDLLAQIQKGVELKTIPKGEEKKKKEPDLLSQIQQGVKLKSTPKNSKGKKEKEEEINLISQIQKGVKLKKVAKNPEEKKEKKEEPSLYNSLKNALNKRRTILGPEKPEMSEVKNYDDGWN